MCVGNWNNLLKIVNCSQIAPVSNQSSKIFVKPEYLVYDIYGYDFLPTAEVLWVPRVFSWA